MTKLSLILLSFVVLSFAQERYVEGEFKGFIHDAPEIVRVDTVFQVSEVRGIAKILHSEGGMAGVLVELRGPGDAQTFRRTKTNERGEFRIRYVPEGRYVFMASSLGFDVLTGTIIVSHRVVGTTMIRLSMIPGL